MLKFPKTLFKRVPVFLINQFLKNKSFIGKAIKVQLILQSKICCLENLTFIQNERSSKTEQHKS